MQENLENPSPYWDPGNIQNEIDFITSQILSYEEMINNYMAGVPIFESMLFTYNSNSISNAIYLHYSLNHKYTLGSFASIEYHRSKYKNIYSNINEETTNFFPKFGVYASLSF